MVFALQPLNTSIGSSGGQMGLGGVSPSLGVYLDTYQNTAHGDIFNDHISINLDGDVIHIPSSSNHVKVSGAVNRGELFYEILDDDSIDDLIRYAGGFTSLASSTIIVDIIKPIEERISNDNAQSSINIDFRIDSDYSLKNAYKVKE